MDEDWDMNREASGDGMREEMERYVQEMDEDESTRKRCCDSVMVSDSDPGMKEQFRTWSDVEERVMTEVADEENAGVKMKLR